MREYLDADIVIVGSGPGGATLAKELSVLSKKIYILEQGNWPKRLGSEIFAFQIYAKWALFNKSKEGVPIYRAKAVGGTTLVSCGNGVRAIERELLDKGIRLDEEFSEAEKELGVIPNPFISKTNHAIIEASHHLGINMIPMPKFFAPSKCTLCGKCVLGCKPESKWSALKYVREAEDKGVEVVTNVNVKEVLSSNGKASGVRAVKGSKNFTIKAKIVIICAGGLNTPVVLQNSGVESGNNLFCDLLNVTYGVTEEYNLLHEPSMSIVSDTNFFKKNKFILSPFLDSFLIFMALAFTDKDFKKNQLFRRRKLVGIMTKIKDENIGSVSKDGIISKTPTQQDLYRLKSGASMAKDILLGIGASPDTIAVTKPRGAHPGGSAAIGSVVNSDLETKIKNLYVCDASVFPESAGLPTILTIIALAKRLAKRIIKQEQT